MNSEHFAVETLMDGFEISSGISLKMLILDKIIYINKNRTFGTNNRNMLCVSTAINADVINNSKDDLR